MREGEGALEITCYVTTQGLQEHVAWEGPERLLLYEENEGLYYYNTARGSGEA